MALYTKGYHRREIIPISDKHPIRERLASRMLFPAAVKEESETRLILIWPDPCGFISKEELTMSVKKGVSEWDIVSAEIEIGLRGREIHIAIEKSIEKGK